MKPLKYIQKEETISDMIDCVAHNTKFKNIYKNIFEFTSVRDGIRKMIDYYTK